MQIVESGASVADRVRGLTPTVGTFVCVVDTPQEKTLEQAFFEMLYNLTETGIVITEVLMTELKAVTSKNAIYTLAHEIVLTGETITFNPSNLARHIFSRLFYYDALYINEQNEIADLTRNAINFITSADIGFIPKNCDLILKKNPDLLLPIIRQILHSTRNFIVEGTEIYFALKAFNCKKAISRPVLEELVELINMNPMKFFNTLKDFPRLLNYLYNICGLQTTVVIEKPPALKLNIPIEMAEDEYHKEIQNHNKREEMAPLRPMRKPQRMEADVENIPL